MKTENDGKNSQLIASLREGVGIVQMVLFKELRDSLTRKMPDTDKTYISILAGSITNEIFGTQNPEERFTRFRKEYWGDIEQELLNLKDEMGPICTALTDALRIQTLCDHQEGENSTITLTKAKEFGFLVEDREVPLPSTFMTFIRELGKLHNLIIPPVQITPEEDSSIVH